MTKITPEYTVVDLSRWARKEHFEVFQGFAQSTFNQTVQLDITVLLKHIKEVGWKFYPAIISLISHVVNRHPEFRMAMKDDELVIWNEVHPSYTLSIKKRKRFHRCGVITMEIFTIFSAFMQKMLPAMAISLLTGLRKSPGRIYFSYLIFRGSVLAVLTSTSLTCGIFLRPCSRLENTITRMKKSCCLSPFRSIILFVMASM